MKNTFYEWYSMDSKLLILLKKYEYLMVILILEYFMFYLECPNKEVFLIFVFGNNCGLIGKKIQFHFFIIIYYFGEFYYSMGF